jgi:Mn2+/Fe2+ NRAMP family transporter
LKIGRNNLGVPVPGRRGAQGLLAEPTWNEAYLIGLVALLGTTISRYLFFWQASKEVEEVKNHRRERPSRARDQALLQLGRIRSDTYLGMALSTVVGFS